MNVSLIACTSDCVYQQDGCCRLSRAGAAGIPRPDGCINCVPRHLLQDGGQRLTDVGHLDQL